MTRLLILNTQDKSFHDRLIYLVKQQLHTGRDCKYIQSAWLNLSTGEKYNDVVIFNPKNIKENMKIYIRNHVCADS